MGTQEKLLKSLEILKSAGSTPTGDINRKKERIHHCHVVTESINNASIKTAPNFHTPLGFTIETFLQLCDDPDADIRMTAEECLNRMIRSLGDENISKVQIELHKEIKKNGSSRSLRAALSRFAQLAHFIRPHKGKPYITNLVPSIIKMNQREDESIHETLAASLSKILAVLGCFMSEPEATRLLKAFLNNISNNSAVIRRTTANCILNICLSCRKPYVYIMYCINYILDQVNVSSDTQPSYVLGMMTSLKVLLPHFIKELEVQDTQGSFGGKKEIDCKPSVLDKLIQVYELCLQYLSNKDHNIINAALETLNVLLQNCPDCFKAVLISKNGLNGMKNSSSGAYYLNKFRSPSQLSVATTLASCDDNLPYESELTETIRSDIEQWIDSSELSVMNVGYPKTAESIEKQSLKSASFPVNFSMPDLRNTDNFDYLDSSQLSVSFKMSNKNDEKPEDLSISDRSSEGSVYIGDDKTSVSDCNFQDVDIGSISSSSVSLFYCTRLITKSFLLTGNVGSTISDKIVRVSVKSQALLCIASILKICPEAFLIYLDRNYDASKTDNKLISKQQVCDVLLFAEHSDPQLRGVARLIIANFIKHGLTASWGSYREWLGENSASESQFSVQKFVTLLIQGLEDESSNCTKQTIASLKICLKYLTQSGYNSSVLPLLEILPSLAMNPYWLIKVSLCELVADLCYVTINFIQGNNDFQNKVVHNILFNLLMDGDQRVRNAAARSMVRIIPNLYFPEFQRKEDALTIKAIQYKKLFLSNLNDPSDDGHLNKKHFISNMTFPFNRVSEKPCDRMEFALSKIVTKLYHLLLTSSSKNSMNGCFETLSLLSSEFPSTVYLHAWNCFGASPRSTITTIPVPDTLSLCINLLSSSVLVYDLTCHWNILNITLNVYAGYSTSILTTPTDLDNVPTLWGMFSNPKHSELSESFLSHIVTMLNMFHHVLDESYPAATKVVLPNLPSASTLSPIKRRKSDLQATFRMVGQEKITGAGKHHDKEDKGEKKDVGKVGFGFFMQSPHYMKMYEVLRMAYTNYKITLESEASEKFLKLLKATLSSLSNLLEVGTLTEFGRIAEEILVYLKSIFVLDPINTVACVQQLLKSLFNTNLTSYASEILENPNKKSCELKDKDNVGFYYNISQKPYNEMSVCMNSLKNISKVEGDSTVMGYLHRRTNKAPVLFSRSSDKVLASYIRIFEPMVIKSLKQYTITSDVKFQSKVLQLLSQLVQLRVNYCLLDSEQVFIGFVLKQFEFIEEGQILFASELIPKIFQFLVQLSYSKQHSKSIIGVPKIIQLCDGLMASGQSPVTHCIPALKPIVEDIFLTRNKLNTADMKELETTREVVLSMLLRLSEYPEVIDLIILILDDSKYYTDNPEKWHQWSRQVVNVVFPMLRQDKIRVTDCKAFVSLRKLVFALNPNVFKPVNDIIVMLYQAPPDMDADIEIFQRWIAKVVILLLILSTVKEETIIAKIAELRADFSPGSIFEDVTAAADPLNVLNNAEIFKNLSPEIIFIRFLFRVFIIVSSKCVEISSNSEYSFIIEEFSIFLMYCLHIFQSGSHCKITNIAISILSNKIYLEDDPLQLDKLNSNFFKLSLFFPTLFFEWCCFLTLLNFKEKSFWVRVLDRALDDGKENSRQEAKISDINFKIIEHGGFIVIADYLSENLTNFELLDWILSNKIDLLVTLCDEPPVFELLSSINRDGITSDKLLQSISEHCMEVDDVVYRTKVLKCIENSHTSQTGALLNLLLPKMLNYREVSLSRQVANLASRRLELLLTMPMEDVNNMISREATVKINEQLVALNLAKKHAGLIGLLNKISTQYYDLSPIEISQKKSVNPEFIRRLSINRNWYIMLLKSKMNDRSIRRNIAELLSCLNEEELTEFMSSDSCYYSGDLQDCLRFSLLYMKRELATEEPVLFKACVNCLLKRIDDLVALIPKDFMETKNDLFFHNTSLIEQIFSLVLPTTTFIESSNLFPSIKIPDSSCESLVSFAIICLELVSYLTKTETNLNINFIDNALKCVTVIFKKTQLCNTLNSETRINSLCHTVDDVYNIITFLLSKDEPLPSIPRYGLNSAMENINKNPAGQACYKLYILTSWLYKINKTVINIPNFIFSSLKGIIISLSRLSAINSYLLVPVKVWNSGWRPELTGPFNIQAPLIPIDYFQETDILEEYIFRITLLGWRTRQQFEESWMCLLSVLCKNPSEEGDPAEAAEIVHASSLAVRAITSLLLQTLYYPLPGNTNVSKILHTSRDLNIICESISMKKLKNLYSILQCKCEDSDFSNDSTWYMNVFKLPNFEKSMNRYSYGQMSIRYFMISTKIVEEVNEGCEAFMVWKKRQKVLEDSGLDVNSCIQFLLDFYTQLMKSQSTTPVRLLHEIVKSTVIISDLFTDKQQFEWLLDIFLELSKTYPPEDELLHQYLIIGICKAAGVLTPSLDVYENIKRILTSHLKGSLLPLKISSLYGLLYLLEGCILTNVRIGGVSDELQLLLPSAVDYVQSNISAPVRMFEQFEEHSMLVWAVTFYLMENVDENHMEENFVPNMLHLAIKMLFQLKVASHLHNSLMKRIERLIIVKRNVVKRAEKQILKLAFDKMRNDNPFVAMMGTQLLFTFMYADSSYHLEQVEKSIVVQTNPENLVQTLEKIGAIFERIKKGYMYEVEVLCEALPHILRDFFSPADILTKVIGEFLSAQQPHPRFLSKVVFKVFESAINQQQLPLLQDWVVFSLSNFTQSFSIGMAVWCLTCFFISASINPWLRSFFPYIQTRVGRYEYEDRKMLCIAGSDFYRNLTNEKQKETFIDNFKKAKNQEDTPFNDLLLSL